MFSVPKTLYLEQAGGQVLVKLSYNQTL